jgi:hypothetical protein
VKKVRRSGSSDRLWEVRVHASGRFAPTLVLLQSLDRALRCPDGMDRPVLCADLKRGTVELRARVCAPNRGAARRVAAQALSSAMAAVGTDGVVALRPGWRGLLAAREAGSARPSVAPHDPAGRTSA